MLRIPILLLCISILNLKSYYEKIKRKNNINITNFWRISRFWYEIRDFRKLYFVSLHITNSSDVTFSNNSMLLIIR